MDNLVRTDSVFGKRANIVGNISADLVLESLGKVYIKSRNKSQTLEELITSLVTEDPNASSSRIKIVEGIEGLDTSNFKEGTFIFDKLSNILYLFIDEELLELVNVAPEGTEFVKRSGDTMTGRLTIYVKDGPPLYVNSAVLVPNLNAQYLNGETAETFTRRHKDEKIGGAWTFKNITNFKSNVGVEKDIVINGSIGSPNFASGFGGYGWRMDADTNTLTIDNLVVRKLMQVYELVVNKISATNGSLWVSNAGKVTNVKKVNIYNYSFFNNSSSEYKRFCAGLRIGDVFIKMPSDISLESLSAQAFSTASGDGIVVRNCYSKNTLRNMQFMEVSKDAPVDQLFIDNSNAHINSVFEEGFRFDCTFPIVTRNNKATYDEYYDKVKQAEEELEMLRLTYASQQDITAKENELSSYEQNIQPRDYVSLIRSYYKYFAGGDFYYVKFDDDELPVFKAGDLLRCQKWTYGGIKYYDALVCNYVGKGFIIQLAPSFFDKKTTIEYDNGLNPQVTIEEDSRNLDLYKSTKNYKEPKDSNRQHNDDGTITTLTYDEQMDKNLMGIVEIDDSLVQMGNLWDQQRQNAVYITSTDDAAPYIDVLSGINRPDYSVNYYIPVYQTIKLNKTSYNLRAFVGFNTLVEIPYTGNYYIQDSSINNFTCEYVCFSFNNTIYLATGKSVPNQAGVKLLYYLNTIPDDCSLLGEEVTNFNIGAEGDYQLQLEDGSGNIIQQQQSQKLILASTRNVKARLGNLNGIKDEMFPIDKQPYGYGLYGQNVFLTGEFYLNNGQSVADLGKDAMAFAIASSRSGNAAINLLRADLLKADKLLKASHYNKGTLKTAGMYIGNDSDGNPGIVIWGNKILFATTDAEFNGSVTPTMLLADGKIQGKYLGVNEAHSNILAPTLPTAEFVFDNVTYTSLDTIRVFRQMVPKTGATYLEPGSEVRYVRKFHPSDGSPNVWLVVDTNGYPKATNIYGDVESLAYVNFTHYNSTGTSSTFSDGVFTSEAEAAFMNEHTSPLKMWAFEIDGKANIGGSTFYVDSTGKVNVNGIIRSNEGIIGGLYLSSGGLFTFDDTRSFKPISLSTIGYGWGDENTVQVPMLRFNIGNEGKILHAINLNAKGLFYQASIKEDGGTWYDLLSLQTPALVFSMTIIPIVDNDGRHTFYSRISTGYNAFQRINMCYDANGRYIINFYYMNNDNSEAEWYQQRIWFIKQLMLGHIHFSSTGYNLSKTDFNLSSYYNTNYPSKFEYDTDQIQGYYRFNTDHMEDNPSITFRMFTGDIDQSQLMKASIDQISFRSNTISFNPYLVTPSNTDVAHKFAYGACFKATIDNSYAGKYNAGGIWDLGLSSSLFNSNSWTNAISITTSDDAETNFGGFTLMCFYIPAFDTRYAEELHEQEIDYDPTQQEEAQQAAQLRNEIIATYGSNGTKYQELLDNLNTKISNMTSAQESSQSSAISSIQNDITSMGVQADSISVQATYNELLNYRTTLQNTAASIQSSINSLETEQQGGDSTQEIPIITSQPTDTLSDSQIQGIYNNFSNALSSSAYQSVKVGTLSNVSSYGTPSVYGIYVNPNELEVTNNSNLVDNSSISNVTFSPTSSGYDIYAKILANNTTSKRRVRLWIQFASANQYDYVNIMQLEGSGGTTPSSDTTLDGFISNITGSKINTVLTNVISASNTPNTYSYLQSGFNYVSGQSNATKSWMLANMLAELTPYVLSTTDIYQNKTETSGDTATNYFVNAAYSYGGLKLDYLSNEQIYMDRINGAVEYAKFKHANYSSSNSAADSSRTELRDKGITQAAMANDTDAQSSSSNNERGNPYFSNDEVVHILPLVPNDYPSNSTSGTDWQFTQSMINQYPTSSSLPNNYEALKDKNYDVAYFCKILDIPQTNNNLLYLWKCMDIGDAGGNQLKKSFNRPRPGTQHYLNGSNGFSIPSGGSIYLCDCAIELQNENDIYSDIEGFKKDYDTSEYDCSSTNNGTTYCDKDISGFTDPSDTGGNPYRSYQSGHSHKAFINLLLAIEAFGDSMSKDGYTSRTTRINQYCLNRAVIRAHWKSDTIAGRFAISTQIGLLNGFNEFRQEIAKVL